MLVEWKGPISETGNGRKMCKMKTKNQKENGFNQLCKKDGIEKRSKLERGQASDKRWRFARPYITSRRRSEYKFNQTVMSCQCTEIKHQRLTRLTETYGQQDRAHSRILSWSHCFSIWYYNSIFFSVALTERKCRLFSPKDTLQWTRTNMAICHSHVCVLYRAE